MAGSDQFWACFWQMNGQSAALGVLVLVINLSLRRVMPARYRSALWLLVAVRFMLPVLPASSWSVFNLLKSHQEMPTVIRPAGQTIITVKYGSIPFDDKQSTLPPSTQMKGQGWELAAAVIWLAGILFFLGRQVVEECRSVAMVRNMPPITDASVLEMIEQCRSTMKLRRRVRAVSSATVRTPATCGFWCATLILPADFVINAPELRMVILHELAHVHRFDLQIDRLLRVLRAVHWFNPMAWLLLRGWRSEREAACDETVLRIVGADQRAKYGQIVLDMVEKLSGLQPAAGTVALFDSQSNLRKRITAIGRFKHSTFQSAFGSAVLLGITAIMLTDAKAQNTTAPATDVQMAKDQSLMVVRGYDVIVLAGWLTPHGPFSNAPLGGLDSPPKIPGTQEMANRHAETIRKISNRLYDAVPLDSWSGHGGKGTITQIPGQDQFIIAQTVPNQEKIAAVLAKWRLAAGRMVNIEAHFIALTNNTKLLPASIIKAGHGTACLDDQEVKKLLANVSHDKGTVKFFPRVSMFDHQDAYILNETQTTYISGFVENQESGRSQYAPRNSVIKTGTFLESHPEITSDENSVVVSFHASDKRLVKLENQPWANDPQLHVQKPVLDIHDGRMTVSVPDEKTLVVRLKDTGTEMAGQSVWLLIRPEVLGVRESKVSESSTVYTTFPRRRASTSSSSK